MKSTSWALVVKNRGGTPFVFSDNTKWQAESDESRESSPDLAGLLQRVESLLRVEELTLLVEVILRGRSYASVADQFAMHRSTARSRVTRAVARLSRDPIIRAFARATGCWPGEEPLLAA